MIRIAELMNKPCPGCGNYGKRSLSIDPVENKECLK